jgi:hypothetical protein
MKRINIFVVVVLALASTSLVVCPQTKDVRGSEIDKVEKTSPLRQVANYPTMLDMTFPEFGAAAVTNRTDGQKRDVGFRIAE